MKNKRDFPIDLVYDAVSGYDSRTATKPRPGRNELRVLCPSHGDTDPSCDLDLDRNIWVCRVCSAGGDVIDLVIKAKAVEGRSKPQIYARAFEYLNALIGKPREFGGKPIPTPRYHSNEDGERIQETSREYFPYLDADGTELFQVVRINGIKDNGQKGKTFRQRRRLPPGAWIRQGDLWVYQDLKKQPVPYGPLDASHISRAAIDPKAEGGPVELKPPPDTWLWTSRGLPKILFELPDVIGCAKRGGSLSHLEGEKKVRVLKRRTGWASTKIPGGATAPMDPINLEYVRGVRKMLIWTDADDVGRDGARRRAAEFGVVIPEVRIVDIYGDHSKRDIDDWMTAHPTLAGEELREELRAIVRERAIPLLPA